MIKKIINRLKRKLIDTGSDFEGSQSYWENRYLKKNNSGSGSYGRLALYKAEILNNFVLKHEIETIIEFGCGDGNQLSLANYPKYKGFDVSEKAVSMCKEIFKNDDSKQFSYYDSTVFNNNIKSDLVISLDVIYHLIEDAVFDDHMKRLFSTSNKYVIIYSSNYDDHFVAHVKCRKFTKWFKQHEQSNWEQIEVIKNKYPFNSKEPNNTSMSDFYIYKKRV